jgi:dipeptidyl-peptidase-3
MVYCKRFFFANGNHHHYSAEKMLPECSSQYFRSLVDSTDSEKLPLEGKDKKMFMRSMMSWVYDAGYDAKVVDLSAKDVVLASCNNFYQGVTQKEAEKFYDSLKLSQPQNKSQIGFNTKLIKENGVLKEKVWKSGGMYGAAIDKIIYWLEKASEVCENEIQKKTIISLIGFYKSGDPVDYDNYCIEWVKDTVSDVDVVNGFVEVYVDALQKKAAYESIVSMRDREATKRISAISQQAQWFEDNSPILKENKKDTVKGISAKVITIISEVGDAAPSTPI